MEKIQKFEMCTRWDDNAGADLAEASFLSIEAHGEVSPAFSSPQYDCVNVSDADEWCIVAHFPHKPSHVAAAFNLKDRDIAFAALLKIRRGRPLFFVTASWDPLELTSDTVHDCIEAIRAMGDHEIDLIDIDENRGWTYSVDSSGKVHVILTRPLSDRESDKVAETFFNHEYLPALFEHTVSLQEFMDNMECDEDDEDKEGEGPLLH